jgi:hypothetical protein
VPSCVIFEDSELQPELKSQKRHENTSAGHTCKPRNSLSACNHQRPTPAEDHQKPEEEQLEVNSGDVPMDSEESTVAQDPAQTDEYDKNNTFRLDDVNPTIPELNTYELVKARFEKYNFKIRSPASFGNYDMHLNKLDLYDKHRFGTLYDNLFFYEMDQKTGEWKKFVFMGKWIRDVNMRSLGRVVVDPTRSIQNVLNLWRGFDAEKLQPIQDKSQIPVLLEPIFYHMREVITAGNETHAQWFFDWIANMVQRPWQMSEVAVSLYGKCGVGKGILFEWLRHKIMGSACTYQTAKPDRYITGTFNEGMINKVFVQIDEAKSGSVKETEDILKDVITNKTFVYEKKFKDPIVVQNYCNLLFTSNNDDAMNVPMDDRRLVLFKVSSLHENDGSYFDPFVSHLAKPEVQRAFYEFLMCRHLSAYPNNFNNDRKPITDHYLECQSYNIPVVSRFLSALLTSYYFAEDNKKYFLTNDLFKLCQKFVEDNKFIFNKNSSAFGRQINKLPGTENKQGNKSNGYWLDKEVILNHLKSIRQFDEQATL